MKWSPRRGSNSHARRRRYLKPVCLPEFHHLGVCVVGDVPPRSVVRTAGIEPAPSAFQTDASTWLASCAMCVRLFSQPELAMYAFVIRRGASCTALVSLSLVGRAGYDPAFFDL